MGWRLERGERRAVTSEKGWRLCLLQLSYCTHAPAGWPPLSHCRCAFLAQLLVVVMHQAAGMCMHAAPLQARHVTCKTPTLALMPQLPWAGVVQRAAGRSTPAAKRLALATCPLPSDRSSVRMACAWPVSALAWSRRPMLCNCWASGLISTGSSTAVRRTRSPGASSSKTMASRPSALPVTFSTGTLAAASGRTSTLQDSPASPSRAWVSAWGWRMAFPKRLALERCSERMVQGVGKWCTRCSATCGSNSPWYLSWRTCGGFMSIQGGAVLEWLLQELRGLGGKAYDVSYRLLNSEDHGRPQHRQRLFIIGLLKVAQHPGCKFAWPAPAPRRTLKSCLKRLAPACRGRAWPQLARHAQKTLARVKAKAAKAGLDINRDLVVADVFGSRPGYMVNRIPTITRTRGSQGGFLITRARRFTTAKEPLALQGFPAHTLDLDGIPERQQGMLAGNAITVHVLARILARALPAVKLATGLRDPCTNEVF